MKGFNLVGNKSPPGSAPVIPISQITRGKNSLPGGAPVISVSNQPISKVCCPPGRAPVIPVSKLPIDSYVAPIVSMPVCPGPRVESTSWIKTETYPVPQVSQYTTITYPPAETIQVMEAPNILAPQPWPYMTAVNSPATEYVEVIPARNLYK